jgi:acetyltransferase-like isoleucine patch superfamily enzyme
VVQLNGAGQTHGVVILTHSFASQYQTDNFQLKEKVAPVTIEEGVFISVNSIVLPGVTIWKGAYIAAGSVVTQVIPAGVLAAGNPVEIKRSLK